MQDNVRSLASAPFNKLRLAGNHGYRFQGDLAFLNAELVAAPASDESARSAQHWALQLWACESPHQGGALRGIKVAQAELSKATLTQSGEHEHARLEVETFATLPAQGQYAMVLVLAAGEGGRYDQVHDFSNYAERQQFEGPRLEGTSGYRFEEDGVLLQAEGVRNTRDEDNLSGSLALELWALSEPYQGGDLRGTLLASAPIGRLSGNSEERYIERYARLNQAPAGEWRLALVLTEWTHAGHVARDYSNFALPYQVGELAAHALTSAVEAPKVVAANSKVASAANAPGAGNTTAAPHLSAVASPSATSKEGSAAQLAAAASKSTPAAPASEPASKESSAPKLVAGANKDAASAAEPASKDAAPHKLTAVADKESSAVAVAPAAAPSKDAAVATGKDAAAAPSKDAAAAAPSKDAAAAAPSKDAAAAAPSKDAAATAAPSKDAAAVATSKDAPAGAKATAAGKDSTTAKPGAATTHGPS